MARIRNVSPAFFDDDALAGVSPAVRLLLLGLKVQADREGRLEDRPERLRVRIFPFDTAVTRDVLDGMLSELAERGVIRRYSVAGQRLIVIPGFKSEQYISAREPASTLPPEEEAEPDRDRTGTSPASDQSENGLSPVQDSSSTGLSDKGQGTRDGGRGTVDTARGATHPTPVPLGLRSRVNVAFPGRPPVPGSLHSDFLMRLGGDADETDRKLSAWYREVSAQWEGKPIGDDDFVFWRARFREWQGTTVGPPGRSKADSRKAAEDAFMESF